MAKALSALHKQRWYQGPRIPVRATAVGNELYFSRNENYGFEPSRNLPHVEVTSTDEEFSVTTLGGSSKQPERTFEYDHVVAKSIFEPLTTGGGGMIFPSGFMFTEPGPTPDG